MLQVLRCFIAADAEPDLENNKIAKIFRKYFRMTETYEEGHFTCACWQAFCHPLLLVLVIIELSDLVFALDSIPAIFAVSTDPFIVYTSNVFAILGLRALYFALAGIIHRFCYLKYGLSLVLVFIGAKMVINAAFDAKIISTEVALFVTFLIIAGSIGFSLFRTAGEKKCAPVEQDKE